MTIVIFILILALLIFVHELGHFLVAKISGVRVDEFAIGFPPKLFSYKYGETIYALNLIPFGGYVKIFGEDPNQDSLTGPDKNRSLASQSKKYKLVFWWLG
jgi:regulator of sigma E protease